MAYQRLVWQEVEPAAARADAAHAAHDDLGTDVEEDGLRRQPEVQGRRWSPKVWRGARIVLVAALLAGAGLAGRFAATSNPPRKRMDDTALAVALEVNPPRCGLREQDVDYVGEALASAHVLNSNDCRSWCELDDSCSAWTFGGVVGSEDVCILKGTLDGAPLIRQTRSGVVSGLPCRSRGAWGSPVVDESGRAYADRGTNEGGGSVAATSASEFSTSMQISYRDGQDALAGVGTTPGRATSSTSHDGAARALPVPSQGWPVPSPLESTTAQQWPEAPFASKDSRLPAPDRTDPFDCTTGFNNWVTGWSKAKKEWCCSHKKMGCETRTSSQEPFDCSVGLVGWQTTWSNPKKQFCCERWNVGCSPQTTSVSMQATSVSISKRASTSALAPETSAVVTAPAPATSAVVLPRLSVSTSEASMLTTIAVSTSTIIIRTNTTTGEPTSTVTSMPATTSTTTEVPTTTEPSTTRTMTRTTSTQRSTASSSASASMQASGVECPPLEDNVDYMSNTQVAELRGVSSPGACRGACDAEPLCDVWVWGDIRDVPDLTDCCFLKALDTMAPQKMPRLGVISGLACFKSKAVVNDAVVAAATKTTKTSTMVGLSDTEQDMVVSAAVVGPGSTTGSVDCELFQHNVDYWTGRALALTEATSARRCRLACEERSGCGAWTWGAVRDQPPLTDKCFLKSLTGVPPVIHKKMGVVSGWPCMTNSTAVSTTSSPQLTTMNAFEPSTAATAVVAGTTSAAGTTSRASDALTTTTANDDPTLFCWSLCMPTGYEPTLISFQRKHDASIFACEEFAVYSSSVFEVAPGVKTLEVDSDLSCEYGGEFHTAMNTWIFLKVWDRIIDDETYKKYNWTVKVDPDSVFFASRLRNSLTLHGLAEEPGGVYINNCHYGLHGPIEVLSANAVSRFAIDRFKCVEHIDTSCDGGPCEWGEDLFLDECLEKVLNVRRANIFDLMIETACDPPCGEVDCKNRTASIYHPFKTVKEWSDCMSAGVAEL